MCTEDVKLLLLEANEVEPVGIIEDVFNILLVEDPQELPWVNCHR